MVLRYRPKRYDRSMIGPYIGPTRTLAHLLPLGFGGKASCRVYATCFTRFVFHATCRVYATAFARALQGW